jgi:PilZ domain
MGVENFGKSDAGSKRTAKRARVLLAARLETDQGEIEARLRDLSQKGALVECLQVPPVGSEVVFVRGATRVPARVAWAGLDRVGLEFHHDIDEHEVFVQLGKGTQAKPQTYRRPGLYTPMSPEERVAARAWGVTVGLNLPESDG